MRNIIKQVSDKHGVSEAEVEKDIRGLIEYCVNSPDPRTKAKFAKLKHNGKDITPEELIDLLCLKLFSKINR